MLKIKNNIKAILVIIGTIIGAGFASGKEIFNFFVQFGYNGITGILIAGGITGLTIYKTLKIINKYNIDDNIKFIEKIKGNDILFGIVNIFLIMSFYVMIAGFSAYFKQDYNIPIFISSTIMVISLYFVLINKIEGIIKINIYMIPVLIFIMIIICIKYSVNMNIVAFKFENKNIWTCIFYAILYSSYNSITVIPILITLKKYITSNKSIIIVSFVTSIIIIIVMIAIFLMLLQSNNNIKNIDLPVVSILQNKLEKTIYGIAISIAIFTSAVSNGYAILENIKKKNNNKYKKYVVFMCIIGVPISYIGFGNLVNILYPTFGALGLLQLILILLQKNTKTDIYNIDKKLIRKKEYVRNNKLT